MSRKVNPTRDLNKQLESIQTKSTTSYCKKRVNRAEPSILYKRSWPSIFPNQTCEHKNIIENYTSFDLNHIGTRDEKT